jgi:hypothetical protein
MEAKKTLLLVGSRVKILRRNQSRCFFSQNEMVVMVRIFHGIGSQAHTEWGKQQAIEETKQGGLERNVVFD